MKVDFFVIPLICSKSFLDISLVYFYFSLCKNRACVYIYVQRNYNADIFSHPRQIHSFASIQNYEIMRVVSTVTSERVDQKLPNVRLCTNQQNVCFCKALVINCKRRQIGRILFPLFF